MVTHEHVQCISRILEVGACAHLDAIVAVIVIPAIGICTVSIHRISILCQVLNRVDALLGEDFVGLCENGITDFAYVGRIHLGITLTRVFRGKDDSFAFNLSQRISETCHHESLHEERKVFMLLHFTCDEVVGACEHMVNLMQHTVLQFVVHTCNQRVVVEQDLARDGIDGRINISSEHRVDGHAIAHVYAHDFRIEQVEKGYVGTKRIGESFQATAGHAVMGQISIAHVVVEAVNIGCDGLVGRRKARVGAIGRKNLIIADARENIVEVAVLVFAVHQIVFNGLTCKRVQVRLVYFLATADKSHEHGSGKDFADRLYLDSNSHRHTKLSVD